jgi:hypothetical protein
MVLHLNKEATMSQNQFGDFIYGDSSMSNPVLSGTVTIYQSEHCGTSAYYAGPSFFNRYVDPLTYVKTWVANEVITSFTGHDIVPTIPNGCVYSYSASGSLGATEPVTWPKTEGQSVVSGEVTLTCKTNYNRPNINTYGYFNNGNGATDNEKNQLIYARAVGIERFVATGASLGSTSPGVYPSITDKDNYDFDNVNYMQDINNLGYDWSPAQALKDDQRWDSMKSWIGADSTINGPWLYRDSNKIGVPGGRSAQNIDFVFESGSTSESVGILTGYAARLRGENPTWNAWDCRARMRMSADNYSVGWLPNRDTGIFNPFTGRTDISGGWGIINKTHAVKTDAMVDAYFETWGHTNPAMFDIQPPIICPTILHTNVYFRIQPFNQTHLKRTIITMVDSRPASGSWPLPNSNPLNGRIIYDTESKDFTDFYFRNTTNTTLSNVFFAIFSQDVNGKWSRCESNTVFGPCTLYSSQSTNIFIDPDRTTVPSGIDAGLSWANPLRNASDFNTSLYLADRDYDIYIKYTPQPIDISTNEWADCFYNLVYLTSQFSKARIFCDATGVGIDRYKNSSRRTKFAPSGITLGSFTKIGDNTGIFTVNIIDTNITDYLGNIGTISNSSNFFFISPNGNIESLKCFIGTGDQLITEEDLLNIPYGNYLYDNANNNFYINLGYDPSDILFILPSTKLSYMPETYGADFYFISPFGGDISGDLIDCSIEYCHATITLGTSLTRCSVGNLLGAAIISLPIGNRDKTVISQCIIHDVLPGKDSAWCLDLPGIVFYGGGKIDINGLVTIRTGPIVQFDDDFLGVDNSVVSSIKNVISLDDHTEVPFQYLNKKAISKIEYSNICIKSISASGSFDSGWISSGINDSGSNIIIGDPLNFSPGTFISPSLYDETRKLEYTIQGNPCPPPLFQNIGGGRRGTVYS